MSPTVSPWFVLFRLVTYVLVDVSGELRDVAGVLLDVERRLSELAQRARWTEPGRLAEAVSTARRAITSLAGRLEGVPSVFFGRLADPPPPAEVEAAEGVLEDIAAELRAVHHEDLDELVLKGLEEINEALDAAALDAVMVSVQHVNARIARQADRLGAERDRLRGSGASTAAAAALEHAEEMIERGGLEAAAAAEVIAKASPAPACWLCSAPDAPAAEPYCVVDGKLIPPSIVPPTHACDAHMPAGDRVIGWRRPGETVRRAAAPASAEAVA